MTRSPSFPCELSVDWAGGTAYEKIGQPRDIGGPNISREQVEVPPDHDSPGNFQTYFAGIADGGEVTFGLNLDTQDSLHVGTAGTGLVGSFSDDYSGEDLPAWELVNTGVAGTATWTFDGVVSDMDFSMGDVSGVAGADLTVKISGKPTLTIT